MFTLLPIILIVLLILIVREGGRKGKWFSNLLIIPLLVVVGWYASMMASTLIVCDLFGMSNFEGSCSTFNAIFVAPVGAFVFSLLIMKWRRRCLSAIHHDLSTKG